MANDLLEKLRRTTDPDVRRRLIEKLRKADPYALKVPAPEKPYGTSSSTEEESE